MTNQSSYQSHKRMCFACTIVGTITLIFLSLLFTDNDAYAAVVINELYPKTEPSAREWVELYNTGSEPVSLDRWKLQNSESVVQSFILNASAIISPHGFMTFTGSQTGISFREAGDTVLLFDEKNNQVDSQSFPSILGFNTSMGRTSDGTGVWALCTTATYNIPNNCPEPSPAPIPLPTNTSVPTPTLLPTKAPAYTSTPAQDQQTFGSFLPSPTQIHVLGTANTPSPTQITDLVSLTFNIDTILATKILLVVFAGSVITAVAVAVVMQHKKKHYLTK